MTAQDWADADEIEVLARRAADGDRDALSALVGRLQPPGVASAATRRLG